MGEEATTAGEEKMRLAFASNEGLFPRDLLRRFAAKSYGEEVRSSETISGGDSDEVELTLGLSLGGRFGAEYPHRSPLVRSSSIASLTSLPAGGADAAAPRPLMRTSSLPTGAEEERRKRKEAQSLKRMEAKRKRLERKNSIKTGNSIKDQFLGPKLDFEIADGVLANKVAGKFEVINGCRGFMGKAQFWGTTNGVVPAPAQLPGLFRAASLPVNGFREISLGGAASQGSSSSGESRPGQGIDISLHSSSTDAKSPPPVRSLPCESGNPRKESMATPPKVPRRVDINHPIGEQNPCNRILGRAHSTGSNIIGEMPCVSTKGEGPNGRRIEGFLYKYGKGADVRIVCICHGSFLTPAEFVRHAGGGEVANPLKHIVVDPSASAFLGS